MDLINDLNKKFIDRQEKFVYYVVALSVTCIGFSVYNTLGKPLASTHIPLGAAIFFWSTSIFSGLNFLKRSNSLLLDDVEHLQLKAGNDPKAGRNLLMIKIGNQYFEGERTKSGRVLIRQFRFLEWGFYLGVIFFVTWHILEMYHLAEKNSP